MKYCIYITTYAGDKLPPKYIGSSSTKRIENGYRGSVSSKRWKNIWKEELKASPELFKTDIVEIFDTRKDATQREYELQVELGVVRSEDWINEGYAQPNGYAGRCVEGELNPNYGNGSKIAVWCVSNPEKVSERNRKAALTQWSNKETREKRVKAMKGKKKVFKDKDAHREMQRRKALISKEKNSKRIEYNGKMYVGWRELYEATGISQHLYKKYYMHGIDPTTRIGANGPVPQ